MNSLTAAVVSDLPTASQNYVCFLWFKNCSYRKLRTDEEIGTLWLAMQDLRSYWKPTGGAALSTLVRSYLSGKIMQRMNKEAQREEPTGLLFDVEADTNPVEDCVFREALAQHTLISE